MQEGPQSTAVEVAEHRRAALVEYRHTAATGARAMLALALLAGMVLLRAVVEVHLKTMAVVEAALVAKSEYGHGDL